MPPFWKGVLIIAGLFSYDRLPFQIKESVFGFIMDLVYLILEINFKSLTNAGKEGECLHELGLMQEVIHILRDSAQREGIKRISVINLVVGKMTAAQPDSLRFAFEVLSQTEDWLHKATLNIQETELTAVCLNCGKDYTVEEYRFVCPSCGSSENRIKGGRELYVDSYEGD